MREALLSVKGLSRYFGTLCEHCLDNTGPSHDSNVCPFCGTVVAVHDVSFNLAPGEILGIMGESGSGKSTVVKSLYFDETPDTGLANLSLPDKSLSLFDLNAAQKRSARNKLFGMVYQNPHLGLNFGISAGGNIAERLLMSDVSNYAAIRERASGLLMQTEVPVVRMDHSPRLFSGGMQQRVQIAKALSTRPALLLLDEVTTGLDLSVQARILDLILEINQDLGTSMIVVTHDLGVVRLLADRTLVMKHGRIIESGLTDQVLEDPQHAYTQRLVASAL